MLLQNVVTPRVGAHGPNTPRGTKGPRPAKLTLLTQSLKITHQRVNIDVDLSQNKIEGLTEIAVVPTSSHLRSIRLDCRELAIKSVSVNNSRNTNYIYRDFLYINNDDFLNEGPLQQPISVFDLYSSEFTINQHHLIRQKLNNVFGELNFDPRDGIERPGYGNTEELFIILPDNLRLEPADGQGFHTPGSRMSPIVKSRNTASDLYNPIQVTIQYEVKNPTNGINFITGKNIDKKLWHSYTVNSEYNIATSSWVPCIDNLWERCTWSIEVNIPRTLKDIGNPRVIGSKSAGLGSKKSANFPSTEDSDEEDDDSENLDISVCTGDVNNVKEMPHPMDLSKKVVSWSIFNPVCAHHVGWAVGCFESVVLASTTLEVEYENSSEVVAAFDEDSTRDNSNSPVTIYCLPGQSELARNTCIFANKAIEFFLKEFGSFPFSSFGICFISSSVAAINNFAGLAIMDDRLLYPQDLIEPIFSVTESILEGIASQWSGVNIVPQTYSDLWCTIGIAKFMSFQFVKILMGSNEYRFKIKEKMNQIIEQDHGKKPLAYQFFRFPLSDLDLDFLRLKAPIVLFILDRRMTKTDKSFGLSRVLPKVFLQAMSGDLQNGTLSTLHLQYVCEKVNRNRLENFFKQWVFGCGVPILHVTQRFNKKRSMIEMHIRQVQHLENRKIHPKAKSFVDDSISYLDDEPNFPLQPIFLGPLTIRVHEADGTPYEHIVELKEAHTKLDIQYNTKFRRLKKHREENQDPSINFSKLGDVLTSEQDVAKWGLQEWVRHEDDPLYSDPFEWIRIDTDFEWIAKVQIIQPDYMFGSQLQFDRDVEAQYDSIRYFGNLDKPNAIHCTILTRTLMDERYYYGVRIAAARALTGFSKPSNNFIGVEYLIKIFQKLYCFPNSLIPMSNDFNDFGKYFVQKELPKILSEVRDDNDKVPHVIKTLLLNLVKYNDNSNNEFQDCYYISGLLTALTSTVITTYSSSEDPDMVPESSMEILRGAKEEIARLQKLDAWVPSHHSVVGRTCLEQTITLASHGKLELSFEDLLYFTLQKHPNEIRVQAFSGLFLLGGLKNADVLQYFLKVCLLEFSNPMFRSQLIGVFITAICEAAIHGTPSTLDDPEFKTLDKLLDRNSRMASNQTNMVIVEDSAHSEASAKRDVFARATLRGAIELLRKDYGVGTGLKSVLWELLHSSLISILERRNIFSICQVLYPEVDSFVVSIPVPNVPLSELKRKIVAKNLGDGNVVVKREGRFVIQLASLKINASDSSKAKTATDKVKAKTHVASSSPVKAAVPALEPKLKLKLNSAPVVDSVQMKKEKRAERQAARMQAALGLKEASVTRPHPLVTIDPINRLIVSIKLGNAKLALIRAPQVHGIPGNVDTSLRVSLFGSLVTFSFKKVLNKDKLREIDGKNEVVHRYVRIFIKEKRVEVSTVPFLEPGSSKPTSKGNSILEEVPLPALKEEKRNPGATNGSASLETSVAVNSMGHSESHEPEPLNPSVKINISGLSNTKSLSSRTPLVEPENRPFEKVHSPASRSSSPFSSASPGPKGPKKKKSKIYVHSKGDSTKTLSSENNSASPEAVEGDKDKSDLKSPVKKETKTQAPLKLKLSFNAKK